jgi:hypothetical protein
MLRLPKRLSGLEPDSHSAASAADTLAILQASCRLKPGGGGGGGGRIDHVGVALARCSQLLRLNIY